MILLEFPFPRGSKKEKWNWLKSIILIDAQCVEDHQGFCTHLKLKVTSVNHFARSYCAKGMKWFWDQLKTVILFDVQITVQEGSMRVLKKIESESGKKSN